MRFVGYDYQMRRTKDWNCGNCNHDLRYDTGDCIHRVTWSCDHSLHGDRVLFQAGAQDVTDHSAETDLDTKKLGHTTSDMDVETNLGSNALLKNEAVKEEITVRYSFIKIGWNCHFSSKKKLSSETTFIKILFHQNPLSSKSIFIKIHFSFEIHFHPNHFHPNHFHQNPFSSKNHFHPKTTFIKKQFHQKPISKILDP